MRLSEHQDFETIVIATGEHFGLRPQLVEKDYYVTEALRQIASTYGRKVVFKGGTSLSKGWALISRFSEDIDLLVRPEEFDPPLESKNRVNKELKRMRDVVDGYPGLRLLDTIGHTTGGLAREDHFAFETRFDQLPGIRSAVMIEAGIRGGPHPTETVSLRSYVAEYLESKGLDALTDDLKAFDMTLLHYRRTYVEKLLALHSRVSTMVAGGRAIDRDARHYADVQLLGQTAEVQAMLRSPEFAAFKAECDEISRKYFKNYCPPDGLSLSASPALFPDDGLATVLRRAYDEQCRVLFYGPYPPFDEVLSGFEAIRHLL